MKATLDRMTILEQELSRNGFEEQSGKVKQKSNDFNEKFMLMVVGEGNFGKSSLINALFNKKVAPVSRLPKTFKIDIYENAPNEQALLYFKSDKEPKLVRIDDAVKICDSVENKIKETNSWKSDLFQVRWQIESDWDDNILLIDTPGFAQFRSDSSYTNFNLFGAKGIQLQSMDGIEYYLYRADFIFWCIKATKLEDADTLEALKNIKADRPIIGIITFMENIPIDRWNEVKEKAKILYGTYIKEFLFFSPKENIPGLPINNTVSNIKAYIKEEIVLNLNRLKSRGVENYYKEEVNAYKVNLSTVADVYDKNINMLLSLVNETEKSINDICKRMEDHQIRIFVNIYNQTEIKVSNAYYRSSDNVNIFKRILKDEVMNNSAFGELQQLQYALERELNVLSNNIVRKMNWETLIISKREFIDNNYHLALYNNVLSIPEFQLISNIDVNFRGYFEEAFNSTSFLDFVGNLFAGVLDWLFGGGKAAKIINEATIKICDQIGNVEDDIKRQMNFALSSYKRDLIERINSSFKECNGFSKDALLRNFYNSDSILATRLLPDDETKYIDCSDHTANRYLINYLKLLKHDSYIYSSWNKNADLIFDTILSNIKYNINKRIDNLDNIIENIISNKALDDHRLFEKAFDNVKGYLTPNILDCKCLPESPDINRLIYNNNRMVSSYNYSYGILLQELTKSIEEKRKCLQRKWDQEIVNLTWAEIKEDLFNDFVNAHSIFNSASIKSQSQHISNITSETLYSDIITMTNVFDKEYAYELYYNAAIKANLIHHFLIKYKSFQHNVRKKVNDNSIISSYKSFNIPDISLFLEESISNRINRIINELPAPKCDTFSFRRYYGFIIFVILLICFVAFNSAIPFSSPVDPVLFDKLNNGIQHSSVKIVLGVLLMFFVILFIRSKYKLKKHIKSLLAEAFDNYADLLINKFKNDFTKGFIIKSKYK